MDSAKKKQVERLLESGFAECGLEDSRMSYRSRLRELKSSDAESYDRAASYYSEVVVPKLVAGADAVAEWIEYGRVIGSLSATGDLLSVDATGRASKYAPPIRKGDLILFIPEQGRNGAFVVASPLDRSAAQSATVDLLVEGRLALA